MYATRYMVDEPMHFPCDEVCHTMLIYGKKCGYQFPRPSPCDGFCYIFPYGKLMGNPCTHMMRFANVLLCLSIYYSNGNTLSITISSF